MNTSFPSLNRAIWGDDGLTLYDSNQGPSVIRDVIAEAFRLPPERVRVLAPYVGGGFGAKGAPHPHVLIAIMAARPFVRYKGPAWITGASIFPFAGVVGVAALLLLISVIRYMVA